MLNKYKLRFLDDNTLEDDLWHNDEHRQGYLLANPHTKSDALVRSEYCEPLKIHSQFNNLFKYSWLPVHDTFDCDSAPVSYKSKELAGYLGLSNLYITYSGYAPEIGARNYTGSFKEFEAVGVLGRHALNHSTSLVLASAGNTARAFAQLGSAGDAPIVIVVPENRLHEVWTTCPLGDNISLYYVPDADYADAIKIGNMIASIDNFVAEGGVRNIGRRDGMACAFFSAVETMQRIPDHYFQAVGSGSGALSVWEASLRYHELMNIDGPTLPILHISQNFPFTPLIDSWNAQSPTLMPIDYQVARQQIDEINAKVLSNRTPPYSIKGGMFEAMTATNGMGYKVTNAEAINAYELFKEKESISISEPAAVTCASLVQAVAQEKINQDDYIMLHITGGGEDAIQRDFDVQKVLPKAAIAVDSSIDDILNILSSHGSI